jgi:SAM-dependent methyltransferase
MTVGIQPALRVPKPIAAPGVHEAALALVQKYVKPPARVVELFAGEGAFSFRLNQEGYAVVASDINPSTFAVPQVPFHVLDLENPFAEKLGFGLYDCVVALEGIEHLANPWQFLRECRGLLKDGGILVLSSPNVECLLSRIIFLMTGGLLTFDRTMERPDHITPIFSWLLDHGLKQARLTPIETRYAAEGWAAGHSRMYWFLSKAQWLIYPFVSGSKRGEIRIVVAEAGSDEEFPGINE